MIKNNLHKLSNPGATLLTREAFPSNRQTRVELSLCQHTDLKQTVQN